MAPPRVVGALDFIASAATKAVIKQRRAQRRRVHSVSLAVKVSITTSTAHCTGGIIATVERSMSTLPRPAGVVSGDSGFDHRQHGDEEENNAGDGCHASV